MKPAALARIALMSATLTLILAAVPVPTTALAQSEPVIYLNQAWSQDDRDWYYHFSQGSTVLSYDIFLNLEVAGGQELFRSDANSERYGLITQPPGSPYNPDGLPIGISKTTIANPVSDWPAGDYAGLTCAFCHQAQLNYKGKRIRIDGAPANTLDLQAYIQALNAALRATLTDAAKFDRLAARLGAASPEAKTRLRERFEREAALTYEYATRSTATFSLPVERPPRIVDAVGGHCAKSAAPQSGRDNGRLHAHKPARQSSSRRAVRVECAHSGASPG
jgi:hypothetical protein